MRLGLKEVLQLNSGRLPQSKDEAAEAFLSARTAAGRDFALLCLDALDPNNTRARERLKQLGVQRPRARGARAFLSPSSSSSSSSGGGG